MPTNRVFKHFSTLGVIGPWKASGVRTDIVVKRWIDRRRRRLDFRFSASLPSRPSWLDGSEAELNEPARAGARCARCAEPVAHDALTN